MRNYLVSFTVIMIGISGIYPGNVFAASPGCQSLANSTWTVTTKLNPVWQNADPIVVKFSANVTNVQQAQTNGDVIKYILSGSMNGQPLMSSSNCFQRISDGDVTWVNFDVGLPDSNPNISILSRDITGPTFTTLDVPNNLIYYYFNKINYTNLSNVTLVKQ